MVSLGRHPGDYWLIVDSETLNKTFRNGKTSIPKGYIRVLRYSQKKFPVHDVAGNLNPRFWNTPMWDEQVQL